jgi:hypothetical protein
VARSLLERFLYRVSIHPLGRQHFVLKGGLLLAQFGARRVTRDIDILGRAFPGDEQEIIRRVTQIAATAIDDGVTFEPDTGPGRCQRGSRTAPTAVTRLRFRTAPDPPQGPIPLPVIAGTPCRPITKAPSTMVV